MADQRRPIFTCANPYQLLANAGQEGRKTPSPKTSPKAQDHKAPASPKPAVGQTAPNDSGSQPGHAIASTTSISSDATATAAGGNATATEKEPGESSDPGPKVEPALRSLNIPVSQRPNIPATGFNWKLPIGEGQTPLHPVGSESLFTVTRPDGTLIKGKPGTEVRLDAEGNVIISASPHQSPKQEPRNTSDLKEHRVTIHDTGSGLGAFNLPPAMALPSQRSPAANLPSPEGRTSEAMRQQQTQINGYGTLSNEDEEPSTAINPQEAVKEPNERTHLFEGQSSSSGLPRTFTEAKINKEESKECCCEYLVSFGKFLASCIPSSVPATNTFFGAIVLWSLMTGDPVKTLGDILEEGREALTPYAWAFASPACVFSLNVNVRQTLDSLPDLANKLESFLQFCKDIKNGRMECNRKTTAYIVSLFPSLGSATGIGLIAKGTFDSVKDPRILIPITILTVFSSSLMNFATRYVASRKKLDEWDWLHTPNQIIFKNFIALIEKHCAEAAKNMAADDINPDKMAKKSASDQPDAEMQQHIDALAEVVKILAAQFKDGGKEFKIPDDETLKKEVLPGVIEELPTIFQDKKIKCSASLFFKSLYVGICTTAGLLLYTEKLAALLPEGPDNTAGIFYDIFRVMFGAFFGSATGLLAADASLEFAQKLKDSWVARPFKTGWYIFENIFASLSLFTPAVKVANGTNPAPVIPYPTTKSGAGYVFPTACAATSFAINFRSCVNLATTEDKNKLNSKQRHNLKRKLKRKAKQQKEYEAALKKYDELMKAGDFAKIRDAIVGQKRPANKQEVDKAIQTMHSVLRDKKLLKEGLPRTLFARKPEATPTSQPTVAETKAEKSCWKRWCGSRGE